MKVLTLFFCAFLFLGIQNSKEELIGTWEFSRPFRLNKFQMTEFAFWMKFTKDKVIFSNSNDKRRKPYEGSLYYYIGDWNYKNDTISVQLNDSGSQSMNTGSKNIRGKPKLKFQEFRFVLQKAENDSIELKLLDRFMYSRPDSSTLNTGKKIQFSREGEGIELNEVFKIKRTKQFYWFMNEIK